MGNEHDTSRPQAGAEPKRRADGWESLGDIGKVDADGFVYITDRLADMILVGGANVYPAEIEAALDEHPAVQSCCVIERATTPLRDDAGKVRRSALRAERIAR